MFRDQLCKEFIEEGQYQLDILNPHVLLYPTTIVFLDEDKEREDWKKV
jgi:hypothetical protein